MHEDDFLDDIDLLEELGNDELEDQTESMDEEQGQQQEKKRFGEDEYNAARDENGKYDKNHYKAQNERLNQNLQDAKDERAKGTKEKKGKVKKDQDTGKAMRDPNTGKKLREDPITKNKNIIDKAKDNKRVFDAKNAKFQNKINNAKSKAFKTMHPLEYAKNQLKGKAKTVAKNTAKKAGKATAKGAKKAGQAAVKGTKVALKGAAKLISLAITNWPVTLGIIFFAVLIFGLCIFAGAVGDDVSMGNTSGVAGASVKYSINGVEIENLKVEILNSDNTKTLEVVPFEKYIMGATVAQLGKDVITSNPEAFKAALIINRNNLLSMTDDGTLGLNTSTKTVTVNTTSNNLIYWDYEKTAYKLEKEDGTIIYSPEVNAETEGAVVWQDIALSETEIDSLESISATVVGKYLKDASNNSKPYATSLTDDIKTKIITSGTNGSDYTEIIIETYGAGNVQIASGEVVFNYTVAAGDYANWKQGAKEWGSFSLGTASGTTMKDIGCYVTSIAISFASLGAETTLEEFNPGTFAKALKKQNAFYPGGGLVGEPTRTTVIQSIVPSGSVTSDGNGRIYLSGSKTEKIAAIKAAVTPNCAIVMQVKNPGAGKGTHFVVLDVASTEANGWTKLMMWNPSRAQNGDVYTDYGNYSPLPYIDKVCIN